MVIYGYGILKLERRKVRIDGTVQGVGYRPFVYNLASRFSLSGWVTNTSEGVQIEAQGQTTHLDSFLVALRTQKPPLASPEIIHIETIPVVDGEQFFSIQTSQPLPHRRMVISPDAAICSECLAELLDPNNRRYRYPFINCTYCGPRYTILFDIPYDRPNTTMRHFKMCSQCWREYEDPGNRRFHAQPNACPVCGPQVWLTDDRGKRMENLDAITTAVQKLEAGYILAIKGLGGFHLAVRADNDQGVLELRRRKYRKAKAFAVMTGNINSARTLAIIDPLSENLLKGMEKPIVLCPQNPNGPLSPYVAGLSKFWGIMLPYTPLHCLLMMGDYPALVMTSGNQSDEPIESENERALEQLGGIADYFLLHNRDIYTRCDDSVVKIFRDKPISIRRARGYVPAPVRLERRWNHDILAVGAEMKNTVTLIKGKEAFVSQHIGDLKGHAAYELFQRTIEKLVVLIGANPRAIACDLHPALLSTRYAESYQGLPLIRVQHHHAHLAAVMGEYDLDGPVAGLAGDGIGYGTDGVVWGCELMSVWREKFERQGWLESVPMPGGDAASRQPWRMAVSYLVTTFGIREGHDLARKLLSRIESSPIDAIVAMIHAGVNCPDTSSLGRFFDAISAILGLCLENTYDAQAAIELEYLADEKETAGYPAEITESEQGNILPIKPVVRAVVHDVLAGIEPERIAARFHNFVVAGFTHWLNWLAEKLNTKKVALGGGVFQNDLLLRKLVESLETAGLQVYFNRRLPLNDGAISFGQAVVADASLAL